MSRHLTKSQEDEIYSGVTNMPNAALDREVVTLDTRRQRLALIPWSEITLPAKRDALIEGLLDVGSFSIMYGASGTRKTFLAIEIACHVALGWEWRGRAVKRGAVVYIAAEGGGGFGERLTAFKHHHEVDTEGVPLHVIGEAPDLCHNDADAKLLVERIQNATGGDVAFIVVDTLARALAGGNENSPDDMGALVRHCDLLRAETGAHLMAIHHTGKDDTRGARGHSSLKAAADTEIEITSSGEVSTATITKQRDYHGGESFRFKLDTIEIGEDCRSVGVAVPADDGGITAPQAATGRQRRKMTKTAAIARQALEKALDEAGEIPPASNHIPKTVKTVHIDLWRKYAYALGISGSTEDRAKQQAFKRGAETLFAEGIAGTWQEQCWPI